MNGCNRCRCDAVSVRSLTPRQGYRAPHPYPRDALEVVDVEGFGSRADRGLGNGSQYGAGGWAGEDSHRCLSAPAAAVMWTSIQRAVEPSAFALAREYMASSTAAWASSTVACAKSIADNA